MTERLLVARITLNSFASSQAFVSDAKLLSDSRRLSQRCEFTSRPELAVGPRETMLEGAERLKGAIDAKMTKAYNVRVKDMSNIQIELKSSGSSDWRNWLCLIVTRRMRNTMMKILDGKCCVDG